MGQQYKVPNNGCTEIRLPQPTALTPRARKMYSDCILDREVTAVTEQGCQSLATQSVLPGMRE